MEGPTLSKSQQEIATPKACKQRNWVLIRNTIALIFVSFLALGLFALGIMLLSGNAVLTIALLIALSIAVSVVAIAFVRRERLLVKIILDALTGEIAVILIAYFASKITAATLANNLIYIGTITVMAVVLICLNVVKLYDKPNEGTKSTRYITYAATFVALSVIFKMIGNAISAICPPTMKISFVYIPWVLSGIVLGPIGGVITAVIGDLLGQLTIATGGSINPLTALANALFPLAPALIFKFFRGKHDNIKLLIGMLISLVVCTMGIGAYALYLMYYNGMNYFVYLFTIRSPQMIVIAINYVLCALLLPVIRRMKLKNNIKEE